MAESFKNLDNILHDWQKDKNKKYCRGIEEVREGTFSFLENGTGKIIQQSAVERD